MPIDRKYLKSNVFAFARYISHFYSIPAPAFLIGHTYRLLHTTFNDLATAINQNWLPLAASAASLSGTPAPDRIFLQMTHT